MKKIIFLLAFLLVAGLYILKGQSSNQDDEIANQVDEKVLSNTSGVEPRKFVIELNEKYVVYLLNVEKVKDTKLIFNLTENQTTGFEIIKNESCKSLVNGGFYSKDNKPIGLFVSEFEEISRWQENKTFNGIFTINELDVPRITKNIPSGYLRIALQSGPVVKANNKYSDLSIFIQKPSRRSLVLVDGDNSLYFAIVHGSESTYSGPDFSTLIDVIVELEKQSNINFADILNLDGGSASAFYSGGIRLPEASPIGSYFCMN